MPHVPRGVGWCPGDALCFGRWSFRRAWHALSDSESPGLPDGPGEYCIFKEDEKRDWHHWNNYPLNCMRNISDLKHEQLWFNTLFQFKFLIATLLLSEGQWRVSAKYMLILIKMAYIRFSFANHSQPPPPLPSLYLSQANTKMILGQHDV